MSPSEGDLMKQQCRTKKITLAYIMLATNGEFYLVNNNVEQF